MSGLFNHGLDAKLKNGARAAAIKDKCGVQDVAEVRSANPKPQSHGWLADCPSCHAPQAVKISAHGETFRCSAFGCGAQGDVITFEMLASGRDFAGACAELEAAFCGGKRDAATGDLFALADAAGRVS